MKNYKRFTQEEVNFMLSLKRQGVPTVKIAERLGRPVRSINFKLKQIHDAATGSETVEAPEAPKPEEAKPLNPAATGKSELSPREMIQRLYLMGYRIRNNKLVVISEREVDVQGIISGH